MDIDIRPIAPEELEAWFRTLVGSFGEYPRDEWLDLERRLVEPSRTFGALDDGEFVGCAGTATMRMTVPGSEVAMAGVTSVGVAPTHRRRGVARALMRTQLDHVHELGREPIAALHASEGGIYGRYGYGVATFDCAIDIERDRTPFPHGRPDEGRVHLLDRDAAFAAIEPVYDAVRPQQPGFLERRGAWWDARFEDFEQDREGASALFFAVHEGADGADAYAVYRFKHDWPGGVASGEVQVVEVVASTAASLASMWRYLFDLDLAARVKSWQRPIDDPLLSLLAEPRRLRLTVRDGVWVRLVDVPAALESRRYAAEDRIVLEVRDDFCPWNDGRVALEGGADGAACVRTDASPDLMLSSAELAAAYLGGTTIGHLARAGRVDEETPGAVRRADAMLRWDPAPWCPEMF